MTTESRRRTNYFSDDVGEGEFHKALVTVMSRLQKQTFAKYLKPENMQHFTHGRQWAHPASPDAVVGDMKKHSAETAIKFERIAQHDLNVIGEVLGGLTADMERQFLQMMYSTVSEASDRVGNTVLGTSTEPPRERYARALEKVQFVADKFGSVKEPELHGSPEYLEEMRRSIEEAPPEFHERIRELKARKTEEALAAEALRKARFVPRGDDR